MATFFLVFFFGQQLSLGLWSPSVWIDRLCIHQTDLELKAEQIKSVPTFVARSSRMLILCDGSYFERLWCNLELATFARHGGVEKVDVLPLWLAPWLLCSISLELLCASLMDASQLVFPNWMLAWDKGVMGLAATLVGDNPIILRFVGWLVIWMISSIATLPASIPSFFSFRMKIRHHQLILDQMADFDVRAASCSEPSDRDAIEKQLQEIFGDQESPTLGSAVDEGEVKVQRFVSYQADEDPLDRFNAYVRGVLRDIVMTQIGDEVHVAWPLCLTTCLPMILYSSVNVLGCDSGSCDESARTGGFTSTPMYFLCNTLGWALIILLTFPLTYPVMLRMLKCALSFGDGLVPRSAAFLCCFLAYEYTYICGGLIWGSWLPAVQDPSATQLTVFLLVMIFLVTQCVCLFYRWERQGQEALSSCRCDQELQDQGISALTSLCDTLGRASVATRLGAIEAILGAMKCAGFGETEGRNIELGCIILCMFCDDAKLRRHVQKAGAVSVAKKVINKARNLDVQRWGCELLRCITQTQ
ncbi:unnamed protein product [Symbiodinium sp. CCMP2592]|nr:unnamed protein product [Symbiodinium sp. CCMP2592]